MKFIGVALTVLALIGVVYCVYGLIIDIKNKRKNKKGDKE